MRQLADDAGIVMGAASNTNLFLCNDLHQQVLTTEFNAYTPANEFKMAALVPQLGQYGWSAADAMVDFIETNNMEFHGHTLIWHLQMPSWADRYDFTRSEMLAIMNDHIDSVVGRYAGRIAVWDVVNEAVDDDPDNNGSHELRVTPWQANIGDDYVALAFERARLADPTATLLYNDYLISELGNSKSDAVFAMIEQLVVTDSVPIDGVGFQMHWDATDPPDAAAVRANMARYAAIGVDVYITEIDVRIPDALPPSALDDAADVYQEMLQACIDATNCDHFTTWNISSLDSWIPGFFSGYDRAEIFDENFVARPAYFALTDALAAVPTAVGLNSAEFVTSHQTTISPTTPLTLIFCTLLIATACKRRRRSATSKPLG